MIFGARSMSFWACMATDLSASASSRRKSRLLADDRYRLPAVPPMVPPVMTVSAPIEPDTWGVTVIVGAVPVMAAVPAVVPTPATAMCLLDGGGLAAACDTRCAADGCGRGRCGSKQAERKCARCKRKSCEHVVLLRCPGCDPGCRVNVLEGIMFLGAGQQSRAVHKARPLIIARVAGFGAEPNGGGIVTSTALSRIPINQPDGSDLQATRPLRLASAPRLRWRSPGAGADQLARFDPCHRPARQGQCTRATGVFSGRPGSARQRQEFAE